ncbi:cysteine--tRNA ligase [bacterium]|nr:MAG: cysteine--tRNA ligase [bacterium]
MKVYNTLTRKKEEFVPINPDGKTVGMYVCGPTVYGPGHLGHARTYIAFDIIRRYLEYSGFNVKFISNITDVHDDIIKKALAENSSIKEISNKFAQQFFEELEQLNIKKADAYPRVSEYIPQIIDFIKILIEKGYAYENNGSVYFSILKFKEYGKLSKRKLEKAKSGTRIDIDKYEKDETADFALWKKTNENEESVGASWNSPWGKGRPGWHIECSAISKELLGEQFDIHGGAKDLIFPHHENEIAQSESTTGKSPFVKYWLHSGLLNINGQKMAKSLGNFITIQDLLKKYDTSVLRFLVTSTHYQSPLNFSDEAMNKAQKGRNKIGNFLHNLRKLNIAGEKENAEILELINKAKTQIINALDDDFNTPQALAKLFKFIRKMNKIIAEGIVFSNDDRLNILDFLDDVDSIFKFIMNAPYYFDPDESPLIKGLLKQRQQARENKDFKKADELREKIEGLGFVVKDTTLS